LKEPHHRAAQLINEVHAQAQEQTVNVEVLEQTEETAE
jgi:hypothetical protein